jgi:RNA polymerase primary sigma factor
MPPLPALHTEALSPLAAELSRAPRARLLDQISRLEALAPDIEAENSYPVEWLVFRLTGYRPDRAQATVIDGADLLRDLSAFSERLCDAARLTEDEVPAGSLSAEALAARWGVSVKTINRSRRRGLVARRVARGVRARLAFAPVAIESFEAREGARLSRARAFTRLDDALRRRLCARARRYRATLGCSLSAAAERLAVRFDLSHEGVRQVLIRHDAAARAGMGRSPIFPAPSPRGRSVRFALLRAARGGAEPAALARTTGEQGSDPRAAQRLVARARLELLRRLDLSGPVSPVFDREDARQVLLAPQPVRRFGAHGVEAGTLIEQIDAARDRRAHDAETERALATANRFLRWRAATALSSIRGVSVTAAVLDRIETDLRWAVMLRAELLADQFGGVVRTTEDRLGPIEQLPESIARRAVEEACTAAGHAVNQFAAWRGGRLAAGVTLAVARRLARLPMDAPPARAVVRSRAAARLASDAVPVDLQRVGWSATWACSVLPDARVRVGWRAGASGLSPDQRSAVGRRWALDGAGPPLDLESLAVHLGTTRMRAAKLERAGVRALIASVLPRAGTGSMRR